MAKWADYGISKVRYNASHSQIVKVAVHPDHGGTSIEPSSEWTRSEVVAALERGNTFVTMTHDSDGVWHKGQDVHIVVVNGQKYIRTDRNQRAADNLENLPEF